MSWRCCEDENIYFSGVSSVSSASSASSKSIRSFNFDSFSNFQSVNLINKSQLTRTTVSDDVTSPTWKYRIGCWTWGKFMTEGRDMFTIQLFVGKQNVYKYSKTSFAFARCGRGFLIELITKAWKKERTGKGWNRNEAKGFHTETYHLIEVIWKTKSHLKELFQVMHILHIAMCF